MYPAPTHLSAEDHMGLAGALIGAFLAGRCERTALQRPLWINVSLAAVDRIGSAREGHADRKRSVDSGRSRTIAMRLRPRRLFSAKSRLPNNHPKAELHVAVHRMIMVDSYVESQSSTAADHA